MTMTKDCLWCAVWMLGSLTALVCAQSAASETPGRISGDVVVFHAGSLSVPFQQIAEAFSKEYPGVRVLREAAGSRACARKIADLRRACDVFGSADYTVIDALLIPKHADWAIKFAGNEMVIAYNEESRHSAEIARHNWYQVLLREDVAFGRSHPNSDPCGYRSVLVAKLAERHYERPGLADRFLKKDVRYIRPKETDLLALLEVHAIDYVFIYRSVAEQHELKYVTLPGQINLGQPEFADFYRTVTVEVSGRIPGEKIVKRGEPMIYGVTIPKNAPNPRAAAAFVTFLLEREKGLAIMEKNGQPSVVPSPSATYGSIPPELRRFAAKE